MRWTRTYDPARNPAHWTEMVRPGQYAVFVFDARTHVARDAEGRVFEPGECPCLALCDDLPEAVGFATEVVTRYPPLCGEAYDHEGKAKEPLQAIRQYAKRQTLWGSPALVCGPAFAVHDFMPDLAWIWGYVIGVKLTLIGGFRLAQGLIGWHEHRGES